MPFPFLLHMGSKGTTAGYPLLLRFFNSGIFICRNSFIVNKSGARMMSTINPCLMVPASPVSTPVSRGNNYKNTVYKLYSLSDNKLSSLNNIRLPDNDESVKFVGSSHGWLALFNQRNGNLFLSNPISGRCISLPPVEGVSVWKVIISCSPDENEEECRAMMSFGRTKSLAFCWPGRSTRWAPIGSMYSHGLDTKYTRYYQDFIYSRKHKLFFCAIKVAKCLDLECWDLRDPWSQRMYCSHVLLPEPWAGINLRTGIAASINLVFAEQSGQLFIVKRHIMTRMGPDGSYVKETYFGRNRGFAGGYPYKTIGFDVYKVEPLEGEINLKLRCMEGSLDGLAMFIGINHSIVIRAAECPELKLKPDCIYFTDDEEFTPMEWVARMYNYGGHDVGIFDYQSKCFYPCYYPCDYQSIEMAIPAPLWFTPT